VGAAGGGNPKVDARVAELKLDWAAEACPAVYWDVAGAKGHPVRATVSEMGPILLGRLLNLNETQAGVLSVVFKIADEQGLLLLDLKDLRAALGYVADNAAQYKTSHGNVSAASVGAIQRGLLALAEQGGEKLFGEPALDLDDLLQTDARGRGVINVLAADKLMASPKVYATLLLWLLTELYERLPEVGDLDKPKLVFFFDEAHLLFTDAPPALLEKIEQVVRLVRSKGVSVWFVSQNPLDIPDRVLGQLGHRVQHALRAFTPQDQKAVRAAAQTFRANAGVDVEKAITELAVGEALVSVLDEKGSPTPVERALVLPPRSRLGPVTDAERAALIAASPIAGHYEKAVDRESAHEILAKRAEQEQAAAAAAPSAPKAPPAPRGATRGGEDLVRAVATSAARAAASQIGRSLVRGLMGSLLGGRGGSRRSSW
jgi:DNA helicase HerA-like ATPase